jgi:hypothetical protein
MVLMVRDQAYVRREHMSALVIWSSVIALLELHMRGELAVIGQER